MAKDWFRRKSWTNRDRDEFFLRLKRSRGQSSKAQYLRVQAAELLAVRTEENARAATMLLEILLTEYPEPGEIAIAYKLLGECCERQGRHGEALSCYRKALDQQRNYPNALGGAHLRFALLVAEHRMRDEYDEALAILDEWGSFDDFPSMTFQVWAARSMIYRDKALKPQAVECARRALEAATAKHSGFRNHPKLGLVGEEDQERVKQMESIVNS